MSVKGPLGGGFIVPKDHVDHLVVVTRVHDVQKRYDEMRKQDGEVLAVDWACFSCDGPDANVREHELLGGGMFLTQRIRRDGDLTAGYFRIIPSKGNYAEGAQILEGPREEDIPRIEAWWERHKPHTVAGPTPTADPWAGQAAPQPSTQPDPWAGTDATPAPPQAPVQAAPQQPAAPNGAQANGAGDLDVPTLARMPRAAVQALVAQQVVSADLARAAGHQI